MASRAGGRRRAGSGRPPAPGFTLIEMLLVLALLGLLSALVAPQMGRWAQASAQRQGVQSARQQIETWSQTAFLAGAPLVWPAPASQVPGAAPQAAASTPALQLPEGWQLIAEPPLRLASNGMVERCERLRLLDETGRTLARWRCAGGPALGLSDDDPSEDRDEGA